MFHNNCNDSLMMKDKSSLLCTERQINTVDNFHVQNLVELGFPILVEVTLELFLP